MPKGARLQRKALLLLVTHAVVLLCRQGIEVHADCLAREEAGRPHSANFCRRLSVVSYCVNDDMVLSIFIYRSFEQHLSIVFTNITIPVSIDALETFVIYFQIFRTLGYRNRKTQIS